ncbi:armadillo-type protein [Lineolata rhizophorae]|uniref:Armadillo-type protein n=1 Tax=Lineolata rhizophorae TaxID=578093 RepID=A0A6A6P9Y5_9PEZI|nr:armadillo-type protein [Lineolata rhizophorae]
MESTPSAARGRTALSDGQEHGRNKSTSVLKSIMAPKGHKRAPSDGASLAPAQRSRENADPRNHGGSSRPIPLLPPDHPHSSNAVLGEICNRNEAPGSPRKSREARKEERGLHKSTTSSAMLRSQSRDKDSEKASREKKHRETQASPKKPSKTKSATNLAGMFLKAKALKRPDADGQLPRDKENTTPPNSAVPSAHTPIWAEFSSEPFGDTPRSPTESATNSQDRFNDQTGLYPAHDSSPSKHRNFFDQRLYPLKLNPRDPKPQPSPSQGVASTRAIYETLSAKVGGDRKGGKPDEKESRTAHISSLVEQGDSRLPSRKNHLRQAKSEDLGGFSDLKPPSKKTDGDDAKMKVTNSGAEAAKLDKISALEGKDLDDAFEAVLDSRNIPEAMRPKMRGLKSTVKKDFIKQNQVEVPKQTNEASPRKSSFWAETMSKRPTLSRGKSADRKMESNDEAFAEDVPPTKSSKRDRPRSRTFTFSRDRDSSPSKKQRGDTSGTFGRPSEIPKSPSSQSLVSIGSNRSAKTQKSADPEEFVKYLRKVQKPEVVEVGKIHKLRLLIRNETVAWVDSFISQGGMMEIVELLHRTMKIEWREEHEDHLLHETLLCLKGLCTTDLALQKLCDIEASLFPALLAMLFDEERKGPSEFTTRGIIISLLLAHLASAAPEVLYIRAGTILSYLRDPEPPEPKQPLPFIRQMHAPRPYRVWCREVSNVTKEVFWIFLHHLNVIPLPTTPSPEDIPPAVYVERYFPGARPPVPAAPYIGGVEWDATQYLCNHLDLLNALIASLSTRQERNALRSDLRSSGWEKVMGSAFRTCKEKFYGYLHDGLRLWVAAACCDGWDVRDVRMGPKEDKPPTSPRKSPVKGGAKADKPPVLEAPKTDLPKLDWDIGNGCKDGAAAEKDDKWVLD